MVTVHRAHGFRFVMFLNDHSPPHVHVFGQGGEAKILMGGPEGVSLEWAVGLSRADIRRIVFEAEREQEHLIEAWRRIHG
jgi:Domain of unknown function (DUF4160)